MKSVAVVGATGYAGSEIVRWLLSHPEFRVTAVIARNRAGKRYAEAVPALEGLTELIIEDLDFAKVSQYDVVMLAMPHGVAKDLVPTLEAAGAKCIIDLSADHRHAPGWVYGLIEWNESEIVGSRRIAVPGCFATAIELALAPLAAVRGFRGPAQVAAATGSTGSGAAPSAGTHHPERFVNLKAYKPLKHQHVAEIRALLASLGQDPGVNFVPSSAPLDRGIFATCFATVDASLDVAALYADAYSDRRLIRIRAESPEVRWVRGTAFCDLAIHQQGECAVILSAIDNLGKGAASQAVQCLNLAFGLPGETGLMGAPCTP